MTTSLTTTTVPASFWFAIGGAAVGLAAGVYFPDKPSKVVVGLSTVGGAVAGWAVASMFSSPTPAQAPAAVANTATAPGGDGSGSTTPAPWSDSSNWEQPYLDYWKNMADTLFGAPGSF